MKNCLTFVVDYAVSAPDIIVSRIINAVDRPLWANWRGFNDNEDAFEIEVFNVYEDALTTDDIDWVMDIMAPYSAVAALS